MTYDSRVENSRDAVGRNGRGLAAIGLAAFLLFLSACNDQQLMPPSPNPDAGPMFARYVAIGNSITAGFQSFGINDSTQLQAYPVLLAQQFGTQFNVPLLNRPGCPAPLVNVFTGERVGGTGSGDCAFRQEPIPALLNNVAFPGAEVLEALTYDEPPLSPSQTDAYKTFLLGGRTELEAAREVQPTFVTVWVGNNDALETILTTQPNVGDPALMTSPTLFAARYGALMNTLDSFGTIQGGVLIGVVQVTFAPFVSSALAYAAASQQIPTLTVDQNCLAGAPIPGTTDMIFPLVPFPFGAALVAQASAGVPTTLDCTDPQVVTVAEALNLLGTVQQYNVAIAQEAADRGWAYLDPNPLLALLMADPTALRPFPAFPPDPDAVTAPFGTAVSRDGLHPSASTHRLLADAIIDAINTTYGTTIPSLP